MAANYYNDYAKSGGARDMIRTVTQNSGKMAAIITAWAKRGDARDMINTAVWRVRLCAMQSYY